MQRKGLILVTILLFTMSCVNASEYNSPRRMDKSERKLNSHYEQATFAGGCFWCTEPPFEKLDGVIDVVSGYAGGNKENPTYEEVTTGRTGHVEAIQMQSLHLHLLPIPPHGFFSDPGQSGTPAYEKISGHSLHIILILFSEFFYVYFLFSEDVEMIHDNEYNKVNPQNNIRN